MPRNNPNKAAIEELKATAKKISSASSRLETASNSLRSASESILKSPSSLALGVSTLGGAIFSVVLLLIGQSLSDQSSHREKLLNAQVDLATERKLRASADRRVTELETRQREIEAQLPIRSRYGPRISSYFETNLRGQKSATFEARLTREHRLETELARYEDTSGKEWIAVRRVLSLNDGKSDIPMVADLIPGLEGCFAMYIGPGNDAQGPIGRMLVGIERWNGSEILVGMHFTPLRDQSKRAETIKEWRNEWKSRPSRPECEPSSKLFMDLEWHTMLGTLDEWAKEFLEKNPDLSTPAAQRLRKTLLNAEPEISAASSDR